MFRLFAIVDHTQRIALPEKVQNEMGKFPQIVTEQPVKLRDQGLDGFALGEILDRIRETYRVGEQEEMICIFLKRRHDLQVTLPFLH